MLATTPNANVNADDAKIVVVTNKKDKKVATSSPPPPPPSSSPTPASTHIVGPAVVQVAPTRTTANHLPLVPELLPAVPSVRPRPLPLLLPLVAAQVTERCGDEQEEEVEIPTSSPSLRWWLWSDTWTMNPAAAADSIGEEEEGGGQRHHHHHAHALAAVSVHNRMPAQAKALNAPAAVMHVESTTRHIQQQQASPVSAEEANK